MTAGCADDDQERQAKPQREDVLNEADPGPCEVEQHGESGPDVAVPP